MSRFRKLLLTVAAVVLTVAAAAPFPASVPLPNEFSPEGIAIGRGNTFYVGSLKDGDIYRGDLRTGKGAIFVDAPAGRIAGGMKVEQNRQRLWVAGGPTGHGYVYSTRNGSPLADVVLGASAFVNDVVVTKDGAYFTDSANPVLYKVPIAPNGQIGAVQTIALSGPAATIEGQFNLNGITATRNGGVLIVAHSGLGAVFTVNPVTGASQTIAITGGAITPGTPDGILLDGRTLWVVENFAERVVKVELSPDLSSGQITAAITSDLFQIPTTVAERGNRLAIVNARFDLGLPPPLGTGVPPGTTYNVVQLQKP